MKNYQINEKDRATIISYLKQVVVPAQIGANLNNIADLLSNLPEIKEEVKEEKDEK